jgi:tryptophan synthase alpha chain
MNRIDKLFKEKQSEILSIYFTAGYPHIDSTVEIVRSLQDAGADMIEIGMPFSDPMADGPVIQHSNEVALKNGMSLSLLFRQLAGIRKDLKIPLLLMGYLNPVIQYGVENFCRSCEETGIDGVILPDLPPLVFKEEYKAVFDKYNICNILLITPQSSPERVSEIDKISNAFIYIVSSSAVTGTRSGFSDTHLNYFSRIKDMKLSNHRLIGFGISDNKTFRAACEYSSGAIIGSAFVKILGAEGDMTKNINQFINEIRQ